MSVVAVAGCGGSNPTALLRTAMSNAGRARAFRMIGSVVVPSAGRIAFNLDVVPNHGLRGTYVTSGVRLSIVDVNGTTYVRVRAARDARLLGAVIPRSLSTRWIETSSPQFTAQIARINQISHDFTSADSSRFTKVGSTTVKGATDVRFADRSNRGDITVRESAMPYPLSFELRSPRVLGTFSRWNESVKISPPPHAVSASQVRRPPQVHSRALANGTVIPSTSHDGVRTFRAVGYSIKFDYPAQMFVARLRAERVAGQNSNASHVGLAINGRSLIAITRFPGRPIPVNAANIHAFAGTFQRSVSALAGHSVAVSTSSVHGIPLLRFSPFTSTVDGTRLRQRIFNAFVGDDEYELRCQYVAADARTIEQACGKAIATLARISPPTG